MLFGFPWTKHGHDITTFGGRGYHLMSMSHSISSFYCYHWIKNMKSNLTFSWNFNLPFQNVKSETVCMCISDGSYLPLIVAQLGAKQVGEDIIHVMTFQLWALICYVEHKSPLIKYNTGKWEKLILILLALCVQKAIYRYIVWIQLVMCDEFMFKCPNSQLS